MTVSPWITDLTAWNSGDAALWSSGTPGTVPFASKQRPVVHNIHDEYQCHPDMRSKRVRLAPKLLIAFFLGTFPMLSATRALAATPVGCLFDTSNLAGIDTVIVVSGSAPGSALLPIPPRYSVEEIKRRPASPLLLGVKDVFSHEPWITVKFGADVSVQEWAKPNVLLIDFAITARQESIQGKPIGIASLAVHLYKLHSNDTESAFSFHPVTYPFILPDNETELNENLREGVHFLIEYLPSYFAFVNHKESDPADAIFFTHPYGLNDYKHKGPPSPPNSFQPTEQP